MLAAAAQLATVAVGLIVVGPQKLAMGFITTVGGFLTVTVCELEKLPQEFVAVSLML